MLLSSCATQDLIVDKKGVDEDAYQQDLAECRVYAAEINTGRQAVERGAAGAVLGGVVGAIVGDRHTAGRIAGVGAVGGTVKGAGQAEQRKQRVVSNCLRGRGYKVLG